MSDCLYHEKQDLALCGVHALNNLLQGPAFGAGDLAAIALKLDEAQRALLTDDTAAAVFAAEIAEGRSHRLDMSSGDFAFEVLAAALETRACHLINVDHASVAEAAGSCPEEEEGFLVHRLHWFALRRVASLWWNVDSKLPRPTLIVTEDLSAFIGSSGPLATHCTCAAARRRCRCPSSCRARATRPSSIHSTTFYSTRP